MSADAKCWTNKDGGWQGLHDGPCLVSDSGVHAHQTAWDLSAILQDLERCMGTPLRWEIRSYPDKQCGLVGWRT